MALFADGARAQFERALLDETLDEAERAFFRNLLRLDAIAEASKSEGESTVEWDSFDLVEAVRAAAVVASSDTEVPAATQQLKKRRGSIKTNVCGGSVQLDLRQRAPDAALHSAPTSSNGRSGGAYFRREYK